MQKKTSSNKPKKQGFDWVTDPAKEGGGYWRKSRKSNTKSKVAGGLAAALVVGAGAAAIASRNKNNTNTNASANNLKNKRPLVSPLTKENFKQRASIASIPVAIYAGNELRRELKDKPTKESQSSSNPKNKTFEEEAEDYRKQRTREIYERTQVKPETKKPLDDYEMSYEISDEEFKRFLELEDPFDGDFLPPIENKSNVSPKTNLSSTSKPNVYYQEVKSSKSITKPETTEELLKQSGESLKRHEKLIRDLQKRKGRGELPLADEVSAKRMLYEIARVKNKSARKITKGKNRRKKRKDSYLVTQAYLKGQAEAQLDIVPGLMPDAYVLGRFDAKTKKNASKNKPGLDWVNDPSVKGGGYYRKSKSSSASTSVKKSSSKSKVAGGLAAALVVGAGAAAIASRNKSSPASATTPTSPVKPTPRPTQGMNKKLAVGAGAAALATAGGIAAARNRQQPVKPPAPESRMPTGAKTTYKQPEDPWNSVDDPWEEPKPMSSVNNQPEVEQENPILKGEPMPAALPPAPPEPKRSLVPASPRVRKLISKAKREQTEIEKAKDKIELGQRLQENTYSPADMRRGVDVEMAASEKLSNLEARQPERTQTGLVTTRGSNPNRARYGETPEESRSRKKKEVAKSVTEPNASSEITVAEPPSELTNKSRKGTNEGKDFRKELGELTVATATKTAIKKARKNALNAIKPGMGDAVDTVYKFKGDVNKLERWASEIEEASDKPMSRRNFFKGAGKTVARETTRKPSTATQELKRGAEVSRDFFDKVFDQSDKVILKGGRNRMGTGNRSIQLSKQEFERITRDYTNADRRALRGFLDLIGFPLP